MLKRLRTYRFRCRAVWWPCFVGLLVASVAQAQKNITVYINRKSADTEKEALKELITIINNTGQAKLVADSLNRFSGRGIYATTTGRDYYRKFPANLKTAGEEGIYTKITSNSVYIVANSELGVQEGIFLYLQNLGFKFYFPDSLWHISPANLNIYGQYEKVVKPDFKYRDIYIGFGYWKESIRQKYLFWQRANLMGGALKVKNGNAYYSFLMENRSEFEKHPEYLTIPLVKGQRQPGTVLNYSAPGLVELAHRWLSKRLDDDAKKGINTPMVSFEAFDGGNYCGLPACKKIGPTAGDQVFYFTNQVAGLLKKSHPDKMIGMLAYLDHIDIPKHKLHDNIFITVTDGYNSSPYSTEDLIKRWKTKVKEVGVYDYLSLYTSSYEMPGQGVGGKYKRVADQIKEYHSLGAETYTAESTYGWISKGLSHYLAARLSWDSETDPDMLVDEFFDRCFPKTKQWVRTIYDTWQKDYVLTQNEFYQWFSLLRSAFIACNDPVELERLYQWALYINYARLCVGFTSEKNPEKMKKIGQDFFAYMWAIMDEGIMASYAGVSTLAPKLGPGNAVIDKNAPWKTQPVKYPKSKQEWIAFIDGYLPSLKRIELPSAALTASRISGFNLVESTKTPVKPSWANPYKRTLFQGKITVLLSTANTDSLFLRVRSGRAKKSGAVKISIYNWSSDLLPGKKVLQQYSFPADSNNYSIDLKKLPKGKYILVASDDLCGSEIYFPGTMKYSIMASEDAPITGGAANYYYVYVPKGTRKFYIITDAYIRVLDTRKKMTDYWGNFTEINVGDNDWGWWILQQQNKHLHLVGIPPFVSKDPGSFLFP